MTVLRRPSVVAIAFFFVVALGLALMAFRRPSRPPELPFSDLELDFPAEPGTRFRGPRSPPSELPLFRADYVGSDACPRCHDSIAHEYHGHPKARSLTSVAEYLQAEAEIANTVINPPGARRYRVRREAERLWHHEFLSGDGTEPLYDQAVEIAYVVGSGARSQAFFIEHDQRLFESPINWYSRRQTWDLAPSSSPEQPQRFEREVNDDCLACHAGQALPLSESLPSDRSSRFRERSIGCERCHGPGSAHIAWHESRSSDKPSEGLPVDPDPIVNPVKLDVMRRDGVCYQCHLYEHSRQLRPGRTAFDFRPGMRLDDVWLIFLQESDGHTPAKSHVEEMQSSVCFRQSEGRFGCLSCHAPHSVPSSAERIKFYQERCLTCHTDAGCSLPEAQRNDSPSHGSCIACHMPRRNGNDSRHTAQTDHRLLRLADHPGEEPPHEENGPRPFWRLFYDTESRVSDWEIRRARGVTLAELAQKSGQTGYAAKGLRLLEPLVEIFPEDQETQEWLGLCELMTGRVAQAQARWNVALIKAPLRESLLKRLALMSQDRNDWKSAAVYLDRLVEVVPWRADYHIRQAQVHEALQDWDRAAESARRAIELNPTLIQAQELLARIHQLQGQLELSHQSRERADKLRQAGF